MKEVKSNKEGIEKVQKKLQLSIDDGKFYEASQMYHSLSQRYLKSGKRENAISLLHSGILALLTKGHPSSALDLSTKLVGMLQDVDGERKRLIEIFSAFPPDIGKEMYKLEYAKMVRRFAAKSLGNRCGDSEINHFFGTSFYQGGVSTLTLKIRTTTHPRAS
jgi:hypothetical protein